MTTEERVYHCRGFLEGARHYNRLPTGGSIRPAGICGLDLGFASSPSPSGRVYVADLWELLLSRIWASSPNVRT